MTELSGQDRHTYDAVFRHPTSGNIEWRGLLAMFRHLGEVVEESNGKTIFSRNGHSMSLSPQGKDADKDVITDIRTFLGASEAVNAKPVQAEFLLVLDHREARIYRSESPNSTPTHIEPYDPKGWDRHVHTHHEYALPHTSVVHQEFFAKIAEALEGADSIFVFGEGSGSSNELEHLLDAFRQHNSDLAGRIVGTTCLDLHHMTEGEILARARVEFGNVCRLTSQSA